jgi:hypothetical protein
MHCIAVVEPRVARPVQGLVMIYRNVVPYDTIGPCARPSAN